MRNLRPACELERGKRHRHWTGISRCPDCKRDFTDRVYCTKAKALAFNGTCPECNAKLDAEIEALAAAIGGAA